MKWGVLALLMTAVALSGCGADEAEVLQGAFDDKVKSAHVDVRVRRWARAPTRCGWASPVPTSPTDRASSRASTGSWRCSARSRRVLPIRASFPAPTRRSSFTRATTYVIARVTISPRSGRRNRRTVLDLAQMQDWFPQAHTSEEASLDGEPVTRITGRLDVAAAGKDHAGAGQAAGRDRFEAPRRSPARCLRNSGRPPPTRGSPWTSPSRRRHAAPGRGEHARQDGRPDRARSS